MAQGVQRYNSSNGEWENYPDGVAIVAQDAAQHANPVFPYNGWFSLNPGGLNSPQGAEYSITILTGSESFLLTYILRTVDLPVADAVVSSPDIPMTVSSPNLTFNFDVEGKDIPYILGTIGLSLDWIWAQGVDSTGTLNIISSTLSMAGALGLPIDPDEAATLGRIWTNDKVVYTPSDGPLLDLFTAPTLYQGTALQEADPLILADKGTADTPGFRDLSYAVFNQFPIQAVGSSIPRVVIERLVADRINLSDAISKIFAKMNPPIAVTVEGVDDVISGAIFPSGIQPQDFCRLLNDAYGIDVIDQVPLKLVKRAVGGSLVIDFTRNFADPIDRMAKSFKFTRADEVQLPNEVDVYYIDADRNYEQNYQPFRLPKYPEAYSISTQIVQINLPFSITSTEAKKLAANALYRKRAAGVGATWDDDDLTIQEGDVCEITTANGTFVMKIVERQISPDNTISLTAEGLLARIGTNVAADAGDVLSLSHPKPYRLWEVVSDPSKIEIADGLLYDPVFTVEDTSAGLLHVNYNNIPDQINSKQMVLGDASVFGDSTIAGFDGSYTYLINHNHIIRIQRQFPYATQFLGLTFTGGAGLDAPALVANGFLRVVAGGSGGSTLYSLDLNNFDPSGLTTISITGHSSSPTGITENSGYIVIGINDSDDVDYKIFRVTKADSSVTSYTPASGIGECVNDGTYAYFLYDTTGYKYDIAANTATTFDTNDDVTGSHRLPHDEAGPVINGSKLAYLVSPDTHTFGFNFMGHDDTAFLVTRNIPAMTVADQFAINDIPNYDPDLFSCIKLLVNGTGYVISGYHWNANGPSDSTVKTGNKEAFVATIAGDFSISSFVPPLPSAPVNDLFANATSASNSFINVGTNIGATPEASTPTIGGQAATQDVWWTYTAVSTGSHVFDASATNSPIRLAVGTGTTAAGFSHTATASSANDSTAGASVTASLTAGTLYYFQVDSYNGSDGQPRAGTISFTITGP